MPSPCKTLVGLLLVSAATWASAQAEPGGLKASAADVVWPRWQARMLATTVSAWWRPMAVEEREPAGQRLESLSLLGDYYFSRGLPGSGGLAGFRATSGLIFGAPTNRVLSGVGQVTGPAQRLPGNGLSAPATAVSGVDAAPSTIPYLGLGYTSGSDKAGWGFSADVGLVARSPGAVKLGRMFGGNQPLEDMLREMRLSPLLNVGVSYSF